MTDLRQDLERSIVVVGVVLVALGMIAAPATAGETESTEMEVVVTEDGEIDSMTWHFVMSDETYEEIHKIAAHEGYNSISEWYESFYESDNFAESATVDDRSLDQGHELHVALSDVDQTADPELEVRTDGDVVVYEQTGFADPADPNTPDEVTYHLVMPGDVTDASAGHVHGNVVTWHLHEEYADQLYVESTLDDPAPDEETADPVNGHEDDDVEDPEDDELADDAAEEDVADDTIDGDEPDDEEVTDEDDGTADAEDDATESDQEAGDDETDASDDGNGIEMDGDDAVPGFGVVGTILVLASLLLVTSRRSN